MVTLFGLLFVSILALSVAKTVGLVGPTATEAAAAAEALGLRSVSIVAEHRLLANLFGCDERDVVGYEVRGEMNGRAGDYIICSGWPWKGWTLRTR